MGDRVAGDRDLWRSYEWVGWGDRKRRSAGSGSSSDLADRATGG